MNTNKKLLSELVNSEQRLVDVVGYVEIFNDDDSTNVLCAIGLIFENDTLYVIAQEDDSFELCFSDWSGGLNLTPVSLIKKRPWSLAIGRPLLWSWVLYNQQGYFDGVQFEFAENSEGRSIAMQLVALGSEVTLRQISETCSAIEPP